MNKKREKNEYLEILWRMKEQGKDSMDALMNGLGGNFNADIVNELSYEDLVELIEENNKIILTKKGEEYSKRIIRAHRLAERLLYDVLGYELESGACEFEHIVTPELVDSICILLGHPRECPHGMPIPEGECCKCSTKIVQNSVVPLTELDVGHSARIAYVSCKGDPQFHKIDGLQIRPGIFVKLNQIYPSYVIECEGANIVLDKEIVSNIFVWNTSKHFNPTKRDDLEKPTRNAKGWGRGFRFMRKRRGN